MAFENTKVFKYCRSALFSFSSDGLWYEPYPWAGYLDFGSVIRSRAEGRKVLLEFLVAKLKFLKDAKTGRNLFSFNWWNICLRTLGVSGVGVEGKKGSILVEQFWQSLIHARLINWKFLWSYLFFFFWSLCLFSFLLQNHSLPYFLCKNTTNKNINIFLFHGDLVGLDGKQKYHNKILCFGWIFHFWEK